MRRALQQHETPHRFECFAAPGTPVGSQCNRRGGSGNRGMISRGVLALRRSAEIRRRATVSTSTPSNRSSLKPKRADRATRSCSSRGTPSASSSSRSAREGNLRAIPPTTRPPAKDFARTPLSDPARRARLRNDNTRGAAKHGRSRYSTCRRRCAAEALAKFVDATHNRVDTRRSCASNGSQA